MAWNARLPAHLTKKSKAMEIVCIELRAWERLKQHVSILTSEVEAMRAQYCPNPRDGWLDSADVCKLLGLTKRTLQGWRATGKIPFSMLGGKVYFRSSDIAELLKQKMKGVSNG